jgi:Ca2+-binding EF-hand superfamily protein
VLKRLTSQLEKIQKEVDAADRQIGDSLHKLVDRDGDGKFSREEVEYALTHLRQKLDEVERRRIVRALDEDSDGRVSLQDLARLAEKENVSDKAAEHVNPK